MRNTGATLEVDYGCETSLKIFVAEIARSSGLVCLGLLEMTSRNDRCRRRYRHQVRTAHHSGGPDTTAAETAIASISTWLGTETFSGVARASAVSRR